MVDYSKLGKDINEIGKVILEKEKQCLADLGRGLENSNFGGRYKDTYYKEVGSNLWAGIPEVSDKITYPHFEEYGRGSGSELKDREIKSGTHKGEISPAKMKSIRSSSAMTYNLLGNNSIRLVNGREHFAEGQYNISYEKKMYTLRGTQPANLDAFLYNPEKEEAIFCEMKMMEWIYNTPGTLSDSYTNLELYYTNNGQGEATTEAFLNAIRMLKSQMPIFNGEKHFFRYDAWQMFKHTLGIYNMTSPLTRDEVSARIGKKNIDVQVIPPCKKITLVNVVFEPSEAIFKAGLREKYREIVHFEKNDFETFYKVMKESGVMNVFNFSSDASDARCFDIKYMSAAEFMDCFDLGERQEYLERYRL